MQFQTLRQKRTTRNSLLSATVFLTSFLAAAARHAVCDGFEFNETSTTVSIPEPIYWRQTLFLIPYQFGSAAEPAAAQAVWLFVSKDRGVTWQKISEAQPHVKSFNYRAEADGEYWFAIRTLDKQGRAWPAGPYQPELRVIVDTTIPRIDVVQATRRADGAIDIQWRGSDANLDPASWKFESQTGAAAPWQSVQLHDTTIANAEVANPPPGPDSTDNSMHGGRSTWQPAAGPVPAAIRATVCDRAGNTATFRSEIQTVATILPAFQRLPAITISGTLPSPQPAANHTPSVAAGVFEPPAALPLPVIAPGWISSSSVPELPLFQPPADQPWPPGAISRAPFRLSTNGANSPNDSVTAYGNPQAVGAPLALQNSAPSSPADSGIPARYATAGDTNQNAAINGADVSANQPAFQPLPPYREASPTPLRNAQPPAGELFDSVPAPPAAYGGQNLPTTQPMLVGSRSFALEYDVEQIGRSGISKVELWGTRDGGQTWRYYAQDDDNRSPLVVTVDEEGLYGFRIVVETADGAPLRPVSGDAPELLVGVDLRRPLTELTAIEPGAGNLADHLVLRWWAQDDNLEPRPISLFYSSRPAGPWSAVATSLENTGEYAWRVERHVPTRFYLRLEARDTAGNLAAFQTRDPIEFVAPAPSVRLRSAEPLDPTATGDEAASYR
jgi:hypothetical protein